MSHSDGCEGGADQESETAESPFPPPALAVSPRICNTHPTPYHRIFSTAPDPFITHHSSLYMPSSTIDNSSTSNNNTLKYPDSPFLHLPSSLLNLPTMHMSQFSFHCSDSLCPSASSSSSAAPHHYSSFLHHSLPSLPHPQNDLIPLSYGPDKSTIPASDYLPSSDILAGRIKDMTEHMSFYMQELEPCKDDTSPQKEWYPVNITYEILKSRLRNTMAQMDACRTQLLRKSHHTNRTHHSHHQQHYYPPQKFYH
ncbi:hypothetical protein BKA69DRAFT_1178898 [Paraphysoderma sedebokerense]|nr:hypothetical protein BKA69DRAFT_1178898 [Paraphysoderma sedebokerense]